MPWLIFSLLFVVVCLVSTAVMVNAECPLICPAIYAPVCAENSSGVKQTFSNECDLNANNCQRKAGKNLKKNYFIL